METDVFMLKNNVLDKIRGEQHSYIVFRFDYKIGSWLL